MALNFCDLLICSLSAILIPTFTSLLKQKKNLIQLFYANSDTTEMQEIYAILILTEMETFRIYDITYNIALYVPFQLFVVMSCVLTVIISITRMIAILKPLYIIRKKLVWVSLIIILIYNLFVVTVGKWVNTHSLIPSDITSEMIKNVNTLSALETPSDWILSSYIRMSDFCMVGVTVIIVAVCSGVTVKYLNCPIVRVMNPGGVKNDSQHRRATIMVLLLSLAFVLTNSVWLTSLFLSHVNFLILSSRAGNALTLTIESLSKDEPYLIMNVTTLTMMTLNSVVNPLIYIARNSKLNQYARNFAMRVISWLTVVNVLSRKLNFFMHY